MDHTPALLFALHKNSVRLWFGRLLLMSVSLGLLQGCRPAAVRPPTRRQDSNAEAQDAADSDFRVAFDFLDNFHQFDPNEVGQRITYHLQRWASNQQPDPDWIEDPLVKRLPRRFAASRDGYLAKSRFDNSAFDVVILREAIWARDLALQIDKAPLHDRRLSEWLSSDELGLDENAVTDLTLAAKIFDWTVRNVQLEKMPYTVDQSEDQERTTAIPPDGAMYLPYDSFVLGRGDWIARARAANLITRQAGMASVVLAVDEDSGDERPWCWSVLIDGKLYLFDFRIGLPVPTRSGNGISHLKAIVERPQTLRQWDLEANDFGRARTYPVDEKDLKKIVALIDASPESLSQRMKMLERQLIGEQRLVLTTVPSKFAVDLRNCTGITGARLWKAPFEVYSFRQTHQEQIRKNLAEGKPEPLVPKPMRRINEDLQILDGAGRLSLPRRQHIRGAYADTDQQDGAKSAYMACRVPDSVIDRELDLYAMQREGIIRSVPKDEITRRRVVEALQKNMRTAKQHASFWLGLIAFEEGNYQVAINYLEKRVLKPNPDGFWTESATYNLARAYEQIGLKTGDEEQLNKSRELLRSLKRAPQATGNRLRAALPANIESPSE